MPEIKFLTQEADEGLPALRRVMTAQMDAHHHGGAVSRTAEGRSGVLAEGLAAIDAGKPSLIVGGVGGTSRDMAVCLGLIDPAEGVSRDTARYIDKDGKPSKDRSMRSRRSPPDAAPLNERSPSVGLMMRCVDWRDPKAIWKSARW
jgi:hypothetical protein